MGQRYIPEMLEVNDSDAYAQDPSVSSVTSKVVFNGGRHGIPDDC
jgi:hypothetical protein